MRQVDGENRILPFGIQCVVRSSGSDVGLRPEKQSRTTAAPWAEGRGNAVHQVQPRLGASRSLSDASELSESI